MSKFKVGDRVEVIDCCSSFYTEGANGKILKLGDSDCIVKFESGKYDPDNGGEWFVAYKYLKFVTPRLESFVWYKSAEHKLQAEEIEGRIVIEHFHNNGEFYYSYEPALYSSEQAIRSMYRGTKFDCDQYMLIDPAPVEEEPMEFDGKKPEINELESGDWCAIWNPEDNVKYKSKPEAIHAWNEWVRAHTK